jgi:predicted RNA polymerase sigma factor
MTLRDYFAAKAMQGILFEGLEPEQTAKHAYDMADAMLKARAQ